MKKYGFTLAEVLITLAILGVLAALTIPNLNTDARREANAKQFGVVVSAVENALSGGILAEGARTVGETHLLSDLCNESGGLAEYLVHASCNGNVMTMKNGAVLTFGGNAQNIFVDIDVNGNNGPGRNLDDKYRVTIMSDGLIGFWDNCTKILVQNGFKYSSIKDRINTACN